MSTPINSRYILTEPESTLPNSSVLDTQNGLTLEVEDNSAFIQPDEIIENFTSIATNGLVVNSAQNTFVTRSLTSSDNSILVSQDYTLDASPSLTVAEGTTQQKIYLTSNNSQKIDPYNKVNLINGANCTLTVDENPAKTLKVTISAAEATTIDTINVSSPAAYPSQIFSLTSAETPNKFTLEAQVNFEGATNGDVLWSKIAPNPGVEWKAKPDGVKSFAMESETDLIEVVFTPDHNPTLKDDQLTVTMSATAASEDGDVYKFDGTNVILGNPVSAPISSIEFNVTPNNVFIFDPNTVTQANQNVAVDFTYNTTDVADNTVLKADLSGPSDSLEISYATAVREVTFNVASNIQNIFAFPDGENIISSSETPENQAVAFGFNIDEASDGQIPYFNGTEGLFVSLGTGTVNTVALSVNSDATDVLTVSGTSPIKDAGTFEVGYNFSSSTAPASTVQWDGTDSILKQPANNQITIVSAGQTTFPASGTPEITVYTGWNPSSANIYFCKACGLSLNGGTSTEGNLYSNIIAANPTLVKIASDNSSDLGKSFSYIVYCLTTGS